MAFDVACFAQLLIELTHGQGHADVVFGEGFAIGPQRLGAFVHRPGGERDVIGDDDVIFAALLNDPIVGFIGAFLDNNALNQRVIVQPHPAVGDEFQREIMTDANFDGFVFDGAGIGVDVEGGHHYDLLVGAFGHLDLFGNSVFFEK